MVLRSEDYAGGKRQSRRRDAQRSVVIEKRDTEKMQELTQFWQSFERAWNARDVGTLARHFDEEAQFTFIDGTKFSGRTAIEKFYRTAFAQMPRDWVHCTVTKEEAESSLSGSVRIFSSRQKANVMRASYQLERSPHGLIRQLVLTPETKA